MPVDLDRRWENYVVSNSIDNFSKGVQGETDYPMIRFF